MVLIVWDIENQSPSIFRRTIDDLQIVDYAVLTAWSKSVPPRYNELEGASEVWHRRVSCTPDAADLALIEMAVQAVAIRAISKTVIVSGDKIFFKLQSLLIAKNHPVVWPLMDTDTVEGLISPTGSPADAVTWTRERIIADDAARTAQRLRTNPIDLLVESLSPETAHSRKHDSNLIRLGLVLGGLTCMREFPVSMYVRRAQMCNLLIGITEDQHADHLSRLVARYFDIPCNANQTLTPDQVALMRSKLAEVCIRRSLTDADSIRRFANAPKTFLPQAVSLLTINRNELAIPG